MGTVVCQRNSLVVAKNKLAGKFHESEKRKESGDFSSHSAHCLQHKMEILFVKTIILYFHACESLVCGKKKMSEFPEGRHLVFNQVKK